MYIQLEDIQALFPDVPYSIQKSELALCINGFLPICKNMLPESFSVHFLYVISDADLLSQLTPAENTNFLILTEHLDSKVSFPKCNTEKISVLQLQLSDETMVLQRLQDYFDDISARGFFADSMLEILFSEGGIQYMLEKTRLAFQNPVFVFDTDFRLLASIWDPQADDVHGKNIVESGGFTQAEYDVLNKTHIHHKVLHSEYPIKVTHPTFGYEQLICTIDSKKDMGHIVLNGTYRPLSDEDAKLLYILKEAIDQQMKKDEFIRNNRGFHYEYFLRDILDGKMTVDTPHADRMQYVESTFHGNMYCVVVETARSTDTLNIMHIRSLFETFFANTNSMMYNGEIIVLLKYPDGTFMPKADLSRLEDICSRHGLYAGMGNCFQNIFELAEYHKQGIRSIELGAMKSFEPGLFLYQDHYIGHIASIFRQKESGEAFCNPKLKVLMDYDKASHSNYAETLYNYLICERNIAATSQKLFMHRNTLVYRLNKIAALVDIDYDDYNERRHIILSYELQQH